MTLNNRGVCVCLCRKVGNQYAAVICVFPSISVNSAFLIHSQKFIDTYKCTPPPPSSLSFSAFLSAGLLGPRHFNLFAVIDLGLVRSYV